MKKLINYLLLLVAFLSQGSSALACQCEYDLPNPRDQIIFVFFGLAFLVFLGKAHFFIASIGRKNPVVKWTKKDKLFVFSLVISPFFLNFLDTGCCSKIKKIFGDISFLDAIQYDDSLFFATTVLVILFLLFSFFLVILTVDFLLGIIFFMIYLKKKCFSRSLANNKKDNESDSSKEKP